MSDSKISPNRIGVIGLGRIGSAIALRLAQQGQTVTGWTRSGATLDGIASAADMSGLARNSDMILLSLFDGAAVTEVVESLANEDLTGKLIADMSTVGPEIPQSAAPMIEAAGGRFVDAPISGGPEMVADGTAGLFIGGAPADVQRFMLVAGLLGRAGHVGPLGSGVAMKIVNNMVIGGYFQTLKEALGAGLDTGMMLDILSKSPVANPLLISRLDILRGESDRVGFSMAGALKDMTLYAETARALGVDAPTIEAALRSFAESPNAGRHDVDAAATIRDAFGD